MPSKHAITTVEIETNVWSVWNEGRIIGRVVRASTRAIGFAPRPYSWFSHETLYHIVQFMKRVKEGKEK